jgi:glycosyltransferase involved in cell wall biosynthesis
MTMRVAILGPYPLDTERLSGVEVAIIYVQRELQKLPDVELHVVTCNQSLSEIKTRESERLKVTYLPRGRLGRLTLHRREIAAMQRLLKEIQPDIVHAHSSGLYAGAALASPYPAVITVHGIVSQEAKLLRGLGNRARGWVDARYERYLMRRTQHLMLITPYVAQVFAGVFSGQSYLVENACDECFFDIRSEPVPGRIFFAGPVIPRKGVLPLLKALHLVRQERPEAHLRIAGSTGVHPDYYEACRTYVEQAGLDEAVEFLGHLAQAEVVEGYRTCALFALPSFQETAPMTIEQAMAAGVPSVATRAGGVPWMLEDGVTGWTLPAPPSMDGDPGALAGALLKVLRDPAEAAQMGQRARQVAEGRFRPEAVARRTYAVYRQVIARQAG